MKTSAPRFTSPSRFHFPRWRGVASRAQGQASGAQGVTSRAPHSVATRQRSAVRGLLDLGTKDACYHSTMTNATTNPRTFGTVNDRINWDSCQRDSDRLLAEGFLFLLNQQA